MRNTAFSFLIVYLASTSAFGEEQPRTFTIENSIIIDADIETVFAFAADPLNDSQWRSEVNVMDADGPWEVGTVYYEDSRLGLNPHYITPTVLTDLESPYLMVVETPEDNLYLQAIRVFEELDDGRTLMTYRLEVDVRMPADASGFHFPQFLVEIYYSNVMRCYLRQLKNILED